jgi:hypothetical protein
MLTTKPLTKILRNPAKSARRTGAAMADTLLDMKSERTLTAPEAVMIETSIPMPESTVSVAHGTRAKAAFWSPTFARMATIEAIKAMKATLISR